MKSAVRPALRRFAFIDERLRSQTWPNAASLARELEVTARTVHRDIEFLRNQLHAPIAFNPQKNGYYYSQQSYRLPYFTVSEGECLALFLAERLLQQYRDTPFATDIAGLFDKIVNLLPQPITIDLKHLGESISMGERPTSVTDARRFAELSRAACDGRQLEISYWTASRNQTNTRIVDPYHLVSINGDWYLIAYCHRREEVLMFSPSRIRELRETGETFEPPADFRINDYLDVGFRTVRGTGPPQWVRLRFTPTAARYVREKNWHPTQELHEEADASLVMSFQVNHLLEVRRWVMSFGSECQVLEPAELKEEVIKEASKVIAQSEISSTTESGVASWSSLGSR